MRDGFWEMERGRVQIELICLVWLQAQGTTDSRSRDCESQVIGNVWSIIMVGFLASLWATKVTNGVARFLRGDLQTHSFSRARFA